MIKSRLTLGQIEPVSSACLAALDKVGTFAVRIKLRELLRSLNVHAQDFDKERTDLIEKFVKKGDDGQPLVVDNKLQFGDNEAEMDRLWRELVATPITLEHNLKLVDVADLPNDPSFDALELLLV